MPERGRGRLQRAAARQPRVRRGLLRQERRWTGVADQQVLLRIPHPSPSQVSYRWVALGSIRVSYGRWGCFGVDWGRLVKGEREMIKTENKNS